MNNECWKPVAGFEGLYEVSDRGRVWSQPRNKTSGGLLKPGLDQSGYLQVDLYRNGKPWKVRVHRLVLVAFVGARPKGMQCRHLDGHKTNNRLSNLRWGTQVENEADKNCHDRVPRGEAHVNSTLCERDVWLIRNVNSTHQKMAEFLGINRATVGLIRQRKRWKHV